MQYRENPIRWSTVHVSARQPSLELKIGQNQPESVAEPLSLQNLVSMVDVTVTFGSVTACDHLSLGIASGETTVLIGSSGCGKSTVLRLILAVISPESGRLDFAQPLADLSRFERLQHMGYMVQRAGLFPHLNAMDNMALAARQLGWSRSQICARVDELCELARFPRSHLNHFPGHLSGGQQQRVSLVRALMLDPELLLLDEPLGALDPIIRSELQLELKELFGRLKKTVVLVTHDMGEAAFFADQIALMHGGKLLQLGTFRDLDQSPQHPFVRQFIQAQRWPS